MDLQGLSGAPVKDYREMRIVEEADGGKGQDWRHKDRFGGKMKARDFEDTEVLSHALRFLFRKADIASEIFAETVEMQSQRAAKTEMHFGYRHLANWLKQQ